jgi:hypothetical protein
MESPCPSRKRVRRRNGPMMAPMSITSFLLPIGDKPPKACNRGGEGQRQVSADRELAGTGNGPAVTGRQSAIRLHNDFRPRKGRTAGHDCGRLRQHGRGQMAGRRTARTADPKAICTAPVLLRSMTNVSGGATCAFLSSGERDCAGRRPSLALARGRVRSPGLATSPRCISRAWRQAPGLTTRLPACRRATARSNFEWQRKECWWMPSTPKKPGLS